MEERAAFKHRQPRCARVHRPHRAHPSAPPRLSIACPSAPCAAVGPEGAEAVRNSEQDRVLTIEPARPRLGGGPPPGSPPPPPRLRGAVSHAGARAPVALPRAFVAPSARCARPSERACPSAPLYGPALTSASVCLCLSRRARLSAPLRAIHTCAVRNVKHGQSILDTPLDHRQCLYSLK